MSWVLKHKKSGDEIEVRTNIHRTVLHASYNDTEEIGISIEQANFLGFELVEKRDPLVWEGEVRGERWSSCGDWISFISTCTDPEIMGKRFKAKLVEIVEDEG